MIVYVDVDAVVVSSSSVVVVVMVVVVAEVVLVLLVLGLVPVLLLLLLLLLLFPLVTRMRVRVPGFLLPRALGGSASSSTALQQRHCDLLELVLE